MTPMFEIMFPANCPDERRENVRTLMEAEHNLLTCWGTCFYGIGPGTDVHVGWTLMILGPNPIDRLFDLYHPKFWEE